MKKILLSFIIFIVLIFTFGCEKKAIELDNKYYSKGGFIKTSLADLTNMINNKETFILFTYNDFCSLPISCQKVFEDYMSQKNIRFVSISFADFKYTSLYKKVKFAPTIIIIDKGKIVAYLDAESDDDFNKYQDIEEFDNWLKKYVSI